jgi:hypothetical protein
MLPITLLFKILALAFLVSAVPVPSPGKGGNPPLGYYKDGGADDRPRPLRPDNSNLTPAQMAARADIRQHVRPDLAPGASTVGTQLRGDVHGHIFGCVKLHTACSSPSDPSSTSEARLNFLTLFYQNSRLINSPTASTISDSYYWPPFEWPRCCG